VRTRQQILDEAHGLERRLATILDSCTQQRRDLSRTETRMVREINDRLEQLNTELEQLRDGQPADPGTLNALLTGGGIAGAPSLGASARVGDVLTRECLVADWVRARGRGGDYGDVPEGEFSLGSIAQALVSGDHRQLTDVERRAMAEGTDAAGGVLVPEELSSRIIDKARALAVIFRAGAGTAPMASDTLVLARLATDNVANWKSENAVVTATDQVWERVELKAKTVVVEQIMSRELFEDLSGEGRAAIENSIAQAIALKLDLAGLEGSGTAPEPRGIANTTGVNSVSMGTNGLKPTNWDQVVNAWFSCLKANSADPSAAVFHPRDLETYALLKDLQNQPLRKPPAIESMPLLSSSQISTTVTQGTSTDTSRAYIGEYAQMIVGVRPSLQLRFQVLQERFSDNLQVGLLAWLRADVALAHPESFAKLIGLRIV
jgi:HK97 family phage major capsid protein